MTQLNSFTTPKIDRVLVLSTAHMPGPDALPKALHWGEYECGYWIWCYEEDPCDEYRQQLGVDPRTWWWLGPICYYARQVRGCEYIRFDCDADKLDAFPTYDW